MISGETPGPPPFFSPRGFLPCSHVARRGCTLRERCSQNNAVAMAHRECTACSLQMVKKKSRPGSCGEALVATTNGQSPPPPPPPPLHAQHRPGDRRRRMMIRDERVSSRYHTSAPVRERRADACVSLHHNTTLQTAESGSAAIKIRPTRGSLHEFRSASRGPWLRHAPLFRSLLLPRPSVCFSRARFSFALIATPSLTSRTLLFPEHVPFFPSLSLSLIHLPFASIHIRAHVCTTLMYIQDVLKHLDCEYFHKVDDNLTRIISISKSFYFQN